MIDVDKLLSDMEFHADRLCDACDNAVSDEARVVLFAKWGTTNYWIDQIKKRMQES